MDDPAIRSRINTHLQLARSIGIEGTPGLLIGSELRQRFARGVPLLSYSAVALARLLGERSQDVLVARRVGKGG
jgi:hypothetical protein